MEQKKNEIKETSKLNTQLSYFSTQYSELLERNFSNAGVEYDDYSKKCGLAAMSSIYQLIVANKCSLQDINCSSIEDTLKQVASLKLNANAVPREVYFQLRSRQKADRSWEKVIEMGIEGDGNDTLLRKFGQNIDTIYPCWLIKEGDKFTYPSYVGIESKPPTWEPKGLSNKVIRVLYPIKLNDGGMTYLIAERNAVKTNLIAHIKNNLLNETFGICESRYKATEKQKTEIKKKKAEILEKASAYKEIEDVLSCKEVVPYISAAWLDFPEAMITRKMRNNATSKFPKDLNSIASTSLLELDETYQKTSTEIEQKENSEEFEADTVIDVEAKEVESKLPFEE